jgi:hypothetical protein
MGGKHVLNLRVHMSKRTTALSATNFLCGLEVITSVLETLFL